MYASQVKIAPNENTSVSKKTNTEIAVIVVWVVVVGRGVDVTMGTVE